MSTRVNLDSKIKKISLFTFSITHWMFISKKCYLYSEESSLREQKCFLKIVLSNRTLQQWGTDNNSNPQDKRMGQRNWLVNPFCWWPLNYVNVYVVSVSRVLYAKTSLTSSLSFSFFLSFFLSFSFSLSPSLLFLSLSLSIYIYICYLS